MLRRQRPACGASVEVGSVESHNGSIAIAQMLAGLFQFLQSLLTIGSLADVVVVVVLYGHFDRLC